MSLLLPIINEEENITVEAETAKYVKDVYIDKHSLSITFHGGDKISLDPWGDGHRWHLVEAGYKGSSLTSKAWLNEVFSHYTFIDGIQAIWNEARYYIALERDKIEEKINKKEKEIYGRTNKRICKLIEKSLDSLKIPEELKDVPDIKRLEVDDMDGIVYFLLSRDKVVYVGQTTRDWPARVRHHVKDGKIFDQVFYIMVPERELDYHERHYIKKHQPKYNKAHL